MLEFPYIISRYYIKNQQDAALEVLFISNCKITFFTCFGHFPRPSPGVLKTLITVTGACHVVNYKATYKQVCLYYWLSMLHYNWVILHAISYIVGYHGVVLRFTNFASPLGYMVFVIVGQNLLIQRG